MNYSTPATENNLNELPASESTTFGFFSFRGRIGRMAFACVWVPSWLAAVAAGVSIHILMSSGNNGLAFGISLPFMLLAGYFGMTAGVKRCHDLNKTGYTYLLTTIPLIGVVFIFYLLFAKGTSDTNRYGSRPKKHSEEKVEVTPTLPAKHLLSEGNFQDNKKVPSRPTTTELDSLTLTPDFDEDAAYTQIAQEIETSCTESGLWLKALVQAGNGDERKQIVAYTGLRMQSLRKSFLAVPSEKNLAADNDLLNQLPKQTFSDIPTSLEMEKLPDNTHLNTRHISSSIAMGLVAILIIGLLILVAYSSNLQPGKPESIASSQSKKPLEIIPSQVITAAESTISKDEFAPGLFDLIAPKLLNFKEKWFECSKDLEDRFRPQCFVDLDHPSKQDYCSDKIYYPKISQIASKKTQYGTNYILLVSRLASPVTTGFRDVYSCEISRAGEVISLEKSR